MASSCQLIGYQENTEFTGIFLGFLILCSLVEKSLNKFVGKNTLEKTHLKKLVGIKFVRIKFSENLIKSTCIILDSSTQGSSRLKKKVPGNFNLISVYLNIVQVLVS